MLPHAPALPYGDDPRQVGNLHLPADEGGPWPCVVLVHGGFWRSGWDRTLMTPLARDLAARGLAAWNVEYRATGADGGGWPTTLLDVAAAADRLVELETIDATRVATCGHSAGGQLALWLAGRHRLAHGAPGAAPRVEPVAAVSLAGVADLVAGAAADLGGGAVQALVGGEPEAVAERYAIASPAALVPLGVPQLLVHGAEDAHVPLANQRGYASAALAAGDEVELVETSGGHFEPIEPGDPAWETAADWLAERLAAGA